MEDKMDMDRTLSKKESKYHRQYGIGVEGPRKQTSRKTKDKVNALGAIPNEHDLGNN